MLSGSGAWGSCIGTRKCRRKNLRTEGRDIRPWCGIADRILQFVFGRIRVGLRQFRLRLFRRANEHRVFLRAIVLHFNLRITRQVTLVRIAAHRHATSRTQELRWQELQTCSAHFNDS